jgi:protein XRP2
VDRCSNTKFYLGPVKASIFFRNCSDCEISVSCSQFRCRDLENSVIFLYTPNDPIVESSSGLIFAPYNFTYPFLQEQALAADLVGEFTDDDGIIQKKVNHWSQVFDFTKRDDGELNYTLLDPFEYSINSYQAVNPFLDLPFSPKSDPDYLFELPVSYGGTLASGP